VRDGTRPELMIAARHTAPEVDRPPQSASYRLSDRIWLALMALLAAWVAVRIDLLHLWATVKLDGTGVHLPDTFAGVDHPFHATRAETLRQSLAAGHLLRWIGDHQGGYPVEFYPLGVAWLEVGVWAVLLGTVPIIAVHKLVVGVIFLLPGVAFALMARRDRWPLSLALTAFAAHLVIPGNWWHGGYTELVQWGLVTNVAASVALLFVLLWLTAYLDGGGPATAAGAALAAAFAISSNPRSLIALGVVGIGVWLSLAARRGTSAPALLTLSRRLALVGVVAGLLAAPEIMSLVRFSRLYEFFHYTGYSGAGDYGRNAIEAVSWPVFALAVGGTLVAWFIPGRAVTRAASVSLIFYGAVTLAFTRPAEAALVPQLEATRLMPFQRLLTIYLAAVAFHCLLRWLLARLQPRGARLSDALQLAAVAVLLLAFVAPAGGVAPEPAVPPPPTRGLYPVVDTVARAQADLQLAIVAADRAAAPGTALLVLGSDLSWHEQLWAPLWTARPLFYNDWLWNWQPRHVAPSYDSAMGNAYPDDVLRATLTHEYLDQHGIGAVVVSDSNETSGIKTQASRAAALDPVRHGLYDVYTVRSPTTILTLAGANAATSTIEDQRLAGAGTSTGGEALIRRNWYPRWRATVNGQAAPITRTAGGYMSVPIPPGPVQLDLVYGVDRLDWLARLGSALGLVIVAWLVGRRWARSLRPRRGVIA